MKWRWYIEATAITVIVLVAAALWFSASGFSEFADSPDGRYHAQVSSFNRGTWTGRINYVQITIHENATGHTVWKAQRFMLPGEVAPSYDDRSKQFITWAADSKTVTIPVGGPVPAVIAVP